ncbi:MAG: glyoxylase-like metal-dependent hydrolase (beta-lactamase superfamily II) [Halobacteriales archaeon]|jgi:glyoxylase-like metal-dependent hydrolase (beta-lactamase superfamily II)/rhodanese-related sulfurtransferase
MDEMEFPTPDVEIDSIDPRELKARIDAGERVVILDVRSEGNYGEWRIEGPTVESYNVPYFEVIAEEFDRDLLEDVPDDEEVVVLCAKGEASAYVGGLMAEHGFDVIHLAGGMNDWARIYERDEVTRYEGAGAVYQYRRPSSGCLSYLVVEGDEAAVIDPLRAFVDRYRDDAAAFGADLEYAIDTHVHADHVSGVRDLDAAGVEGVIPEASTKRDVTYDDELTLAGDGDTFEVGDATIEAVHTPGHTSGMTSYLIDDSVLLTGDGLFVESVARPDLEKGDAGAPDAARQLYETLQERILSLDDDVVVGGGHYSDAAAPAADGTYTARIGELLEDMDALSMDEEAFVDLILDDMPPRPANYEDIIAINLGQRETDEEEAFELELGPNNCAASRDGLTGD